tara:strand:+ start:782 stop:1447 length:666 start_codon:yes stop_codon:yes gene_type:complete
LEDLKKNWWNKKGDFKILHKINPIRIEYILKNFKRPLKGKKVLDIGCGGGLVSESLSLKGAFVTAIDENNKNLNQAKNHAKINSLKINYIKSSFDNFYKKNKNKFDLILCLEVLEHIENFKKTLQQITTLLKPKGTLVLSTINRNLKSLILAKIFGEYILNWIPIGTHEFEKFIKPVEIIDVLENKNLKIKDIKGLEFNPISKQWLLTNNTNVNYFIVGKK